MTQTRFDRGETIPDIDTYDVLVVMGGAMNIYQYRDYPCLIEQSRCVEKFLEKSGRVLGICLGAQVLADVLGGRVHQNPEREIGWHPLYLTETAAGSPLKIALQDGQHILQWHGDNFDLPDATERLAYSEACPNQAFMYGTRAMGLQFHLEVGPEDIENMILDNRADFRFSGKWIQSEAEIRQKAEQYSAAAEQSLFRLMDLFVG